MGDGAADFSSRRRAGRTRDGRALSESLCYDQTGTGTRMPLVQKQGHCFAPAVGEGGEEIPIDAIEESVARAFNVCRMDMAGARPNLRINDYPSCARRARHAAAYLCLKVASAPAARIGGRFGFTASTVRGLPRRVERLISEDSDFAARLAEAVRALQAIYEPLGVARSGTQPRQYEAARRSGRQTDDRARSDGFAELGGREPQ
jgi:hypothetical protein